MTIWNAAIVTAVREFWDTVEDMAHTRAWEMITREEQSAEAEMKIEPIWSKGKWNGVDDRPRHPFFPSNSRFRLCYDLHLHRPPGRICPDISAILMILELKNNFPLIFSILLDSESSYGSPVK